MNEKKLTLPIVIGRKYVRRDGVVVPAREQHPDIAGCAYVGGENVATPDDEEHAFIDTGRIHATAGWTNPLDLVADYVEAPALPDGFTAWGGGAQPAETRGRRVKCLFLNVPHASINLAADDLVWAHGNPALRDIIAYKLADEQPAAEPAPAPALAPASTPSGQQGHSHAQVLRWIADGQWPQRMSNMGEWRKQTPEQTLAQISALRYPPDRYRLAPPKPRMIVVNGIEVPAGETSAPAHGTDCFLADPVCADWVSTMEWSGLKSHKAALERGLVYLDRAACEQRSKAMAATQEAA